MELAYPHVIRPAEAAELLCVSPRTLSNLERDRGLPVHKIGPGPNSGRRYLTAELLAWLAAQGRNDDTDRIAS